MSGDHKLKRLHQKWHHSSRGAKKPLCCRPLNSVLNHTLGGVPFQARRWSRRTTSGKTEKKKKKKKKKKGGKKAPTLPAHPSEGPRGKSSTKTDGDSAEQFMHSSVWLGQDLRDYETLVEGVGE
ncbi:unnamed protein product [Pleuronectes platessa]|uniref:Uncharacterized protein n=1 Tax=Pleuronectes platessa TaxID=8262 RepID=A0A9N7V9P4_PLEPL|nr:unnamed protein product [Pleuronectes platessa]